MAQGTCRLTALTSLHPYARTSSSFVQAQPCLHKITQCKRRPCRLHNDNWPPTLGHAKAKQISSNVTAVISLVIGMRSRQRPLAYVDEQPVVSIIGCAKRISITEMRKCTAVNRMPTCVCGIFSWGRDIRCRIEGLISTSRASQHSTPRVEEAFYSLKWYAQKK